MADIGVDGGGAAGLGVAVPFPFPATTAGGGREAFKRWRVFIGNLVRQVVHTGTGLQKTVVRAESRKLRR